MYEVIPGDVRAWAEAYKGPQFHAVLSDPPYGLGTPPDPLQMLRAWLATGHLDVKGTGFMGRSWDAFVPQPATWSAVGRLLLPGAHALAFYGARTFDLGVLAMRIAGFEIRDQLEWIYGGGFAKSLEVGKAIGGVGGAQSKAVGARHHGARETPDGTEEARRWKGFGTSLKPAHEPIVIARRPLQGTVTANVMTHGAGALNVNGCRIAAAPGDYDHPGCEDRRGTQGVCYGGMPNRHSQCPPNPFGRWPANLIHDGSPEVVRMFPNSVARKPIDGERGKGFWRVVSGKRDPLPCGPQYGDSGSAARFFFAAQQDALDTCDPLYYHPRASRRERDAGLARNTHPTVKPIALCTYLARLLLPPPLPHGRARRMLVPFAGSGSEMIGAILAGWDEVIGVELLPEHVEMAKARLAYWAAKAPKQLTLFRR